MDGSIAWTLAEWPYDGSEEDQLVFLGPGERARWETMRFDKRRREWLSGRVTAKRLLLRLYSSAKPTEIEIQNEPKGAPYANLAGERLPGCLSISHRSGLAAAAWCSDGMPIGIDIERIEARSTGFIEDYFTAAENQFVDRLVTSERDPWAAVLWSGKESVLKVLRKGLRLDTRQVEILPGVMGPPDSTGWQPLTVRCALIPHVRAVWRREGAFVLTLAAASSAGGLVFVRVDLGN